MGLPATMTSVGTAIQVLPAPTTSSQLGNLIATPERDEIAVRTPLASTGLVSVGTFMAGLLMPLSGPLAIPTLICTTVILAACWFFVSLTIALVWREWSFGNALQRFDSAARAQLGAPYTRWRVHVTQVERAVELSLVRYVPQHRAGSHPQYRAELVQSVTVDPDSEDAAVQALHRLQVEAERAEAHAAIAYDEQHALAQTTEAFAERLQAQLPAR
jgi:hypothetical protein